MAAKKSKSSAKTTTSARKTGSASKRGTGKRELIAPRGDKRYVRRDSAGQFKESDDVGRSLSSDRRRSAKRAAPRGEGDRGDRRK